MLKPDRVNCLLLCITYLGAIPVIIDPGMGVSSLLNCIKTTNP